MSLLPLPVYNKFLSNTFNKLTDYLEKVEEKYFNDNKNENFQNFTTGKVPDLSVSDGNITFINQEGQFIFSRQPSIRELWVSSPVSGPWKFKISNKPCDEEKSYAFRARVGSVPDQELFEMVLSEIQ